MTEIMATVFLKVFNMSVAASWIVLTVLLLRLLFKKAPKWLTVSLWGIVAIRLLCPFSFESVLSLIPSAETVSPGILMEKTPGVNTGIPVLNEALNYAIQINFTPGPGDSANPLQIWIPLLAIIWISGVVVLLTYLAISYLRLRRKISTAVLLRENIYQSEHAASPFVVGVIKPKIYMPYHLCERDAEHVITHEQAHIRRKDHWWKPLGFLLLALHWFNPLLWIGYVLLCKDIEFACDEKVIKALDREQKADYSQALLTCSVRCRTLSACPLAFGEVGVKSRVKSVLRYKKPAVWVIIAAVALCVVLAACTLTDPLKITYEGPVSCKVTWGIDEAGNEVCTIYELTETAMEEILSVLNRGEWADDAEFIITDYPYDVTFRTEKQTIFYSTDCGRFYDMTNRRSFTLPAKKKAEFERIFGTDPIES